jgi:hypothetical protein
METIIAKNKIDALKKAGHERIYFKGNKPYAYVNSIYSYHIYAIVIAKGEYYISKERVY